MIKRTIIITGLLWLTGLCAQAQIQYGVKVSAGFAYQDIANRIVLSTSSIKTFNIKGIAQLPLKNSYWLEGGLGIAGKGSEVFTDGLTTTSHLTYLELPLSLVRKLPFTDLGIFYVGAGGYVAMGLGGKLIYETPGSTTSDKAVFGSEADARKIDAGLNFTTGFEFKNNLTFNIGFALGLNNIASNPQQDSGTSVVKNREFSIGLGYLF